MSSGEHGAGGVNSVTALVEAPLESDFWEVRWAGADDRTRQSPRGVGANRGSARSPSSKPSCRAVVEPPTAPASAKLDANTCCASR
jgi:hypothetical protein